MSLKTGTKAPEFSLYNQNGEMISSASLKGQKYILFFYSEADTTVCTQQACHFNDHLDEWKKQGFRIFSISPDKVEKLKKFQVKYGFRYTLLSDPDYAIMKRYECWGPKIFFGKQVIGLLRNIYAIDENGKIMAVVERALSKKSSAQLKSALTPK